MTGARLFGSTSLCRTELTWREAHVKIKQETDFPNSGHVALTIEEGHHHFDLLVRNPGWSQGTVEFRVNGTAVATSSNPSSYVSINRTWQKGDKLEFVLPMSLHEQAMPDDPKRIALMVGPVVLAADLGSAQDPMPRTPVLVTDDKPIAEWLKPVPNKPLEFEVSEAARPTALHFLPFYVVHHNRYGVYFDKFTEADWDKTEAEYRAEEVRVKDLASRTIDQMTIGQMQPERDHNLKSQRNDVRDVNGRSFRTAMTDGWFEFDMKVEANAANDLVLTYWGNERIHPDFAILVDGTLLASETLAQHHENRFFDIEYTIPAELTKGKSKVTVRVQPFTGKSGPSVAGARIVKTKQ